MKKLLFFLCLLNSTIVLGQNFPRDTSFNLRDDYAKNIKNFPQLQSVPIDLKNLSVYNDIVYSSSNGRDLHVDIYQPNAIQPLKKSVIILIHGGGWRSGNKDMMAGLASRLAGLGYAVIVPEYRLSLEAIYPAGINDLKDVIKWCYTNKKQYKFNTKQIAVMGTSSGAQMASQLGNNIDTKYKVSATVNIDGVLAFRHPESTEGSVAIQWLGGTYEEKTKTWIEASAMHNVNKKTAPILFIGSSMPRFHAGRADMITKLNDLNIYSDLLVFDDSPHTFWFYEPWFTPMLEKIDLFLKKVW